MPLFNKRITQNGNNRVTQQTGEPPGGLNQSPGTSPFVPASIGGNDPGLPYNNTSVPLTGPPSEPNPPPVLTGWIYDALRGGIGIARDAINNLARTVTLSVDQVTTFLNGLSINRDSISAGGGVDGYPVQYAIDVPVFQDRRGLTHGVTGIAIQTPFENLFYNAYNILSSDWTYANCSASVDATKTPFVPGGSIWAVTKTSTTNFATITHGNTSYTLAPNTDYVIGWPFLRSSTAKHFSLKPNFSGSGWTHVANCSFDLSTLTAFEKAFSVTGTGAPGTISIGDTLQPNLIQLNETHCIAWIKFNSYNNTTATIQIIWDSEDVAEQGVMYLGEPFLEKGSTPSLAQLPTTAPYHPRPSSLTSARWNTLAGSTTIGEFGAGINRLPNIDFTGATVSLTNVSRTVNANGGWEGSGNSYTLTDTSNVAFGFAQYQQIVNLTNASDKVYGGFFFKTPPGSASCRFRVQIYSTGTLLPNIYLANYSTWSTVSSIDSGQGAVQAEVVPTSDPNIQLVIAELININNGDNLRWTLYPSYGSAAETESIEVFSPFLIAQGAATLWNFSTVTPFKAEDVVENISTQSTLMGTIAVDYDRLDMGISLENTWEPNTAYSVGDDVAYNDTAYSCAIAHTSGATFNAANWTLVYSITAPVSQYLFSLNDGTANNRVEMYVRRINGLVMAYAELVNNTGTVINLSGQAPGQGPGRWWATWDSSSFSIGKDGTIIASYSGNVSPPNNPLNLYLGKDRNLNNPINSDLMHYFWSPEKRTKDFINSIDRPVVTSSQLLAMDIATREAADLLKSRFRQGIARFDTTDVGIITNTGQSFARSSFGGIPVYTTYNWLQTKGTWNAACFMHGCSVRDAVNDADFDPITNNGAGNDTLQTMLATIDAGNTVLTNDWVQTNGFPSTSYVGESPIVSSCYQFSAFMINYFGQTSPLFRIVGGAVGSQTDGSIAAISNTSGDPWLQYVDWHTKTYAKIQTQWGVPTSKIKFLGADINHGESGYRAKNWEINYINGGTANTGIGISGWINNIDALAVSIYGQDAGSQKPLHVVSIPSMNWQEDGNAICDAWRYMEDTRDNVVVAFATYSGQNSGVPGNEHPTSWGAITDGLHKARARYYVQVLGQNWITPRVHRAWQCGNKIYIGCIAMQYPMQQLPVSGYFNPAIESIPNDGWVFWDDLQQADVESVYVDPNYPSIIQVTLKEWPTRPLRYGYAQKTGSNGRGEWFDSSPDFTVWDYHFESYDYPDRDVSNYYTCVRGASPLLPAIGECDML